MFDKTKEEEELELYQQYLNDMAGNPMEAKQNVDSARGRRDRAEEVSDWGSLAKDLGLLAGGLIGGVAGGDVGAGMATVAPSMGERIGQTGISRADRDLQEADARRKEAMMASKGLRDVRREDVKDVRDAQAFETQQAQAEQSMQMGALQIESLKNQMNDEASLRDPESEISLMYQEIMRAAGVPTENLSAKDISMTYPVVAQMAQLALQKDSADLQREQFAEQKSQFDRTMQFQADMKQMEIARAMMESASKADIDKFERATKLTDPLNANAEFRDAKRDLNTIHEMQTILKSGTDNVQQNMKVLALAQDLLRNPARAAEIEAATGRGIGIWTGLLEKGKELLGEGNVPIKVMSDIESMLQVIKPARMDTVNRIQQPYFRALENQGLSPQNAVQNLVFAEFYE